MPYRMQDPARFFAGENPGTGTVTLVNATGSHSASSAKIDEILAEAWCAGDSTYAAVCYLLQRLSDSAGIDIPDDNYSMTELAVLTAEAEAT